MAKRAIAGCRGILTGASSGIGRALASQLVREGAKVVAVARRDQRLRQLAAELAGASGRLEIVTGDVTLAEVRHAAIERALREFGGLDLVINNAGIGASGRFDQATSERLRRVMEVNFFAPAEMIRAALPHMRSGTRPIVVNVSSILGHRGIPRCAEYCASKFALQGLSESMRAELAAWGVDLLVVSPGTTYTEFFEHVIDAGETAEPRRGGVPPEVVARRTVAAIRRGRHEIVITAGAKLLLWMNRLCPRLVDGILARYA